MSGAFPAHDHAARRAAVLDQLGPEGAMVLCANARVMVGRDTILPYRPEPNLLYLTGLAEPDTVVVLAASASPGPFIVFGPRRDRERERWTGARPDAQELGEKAGADAAFPLDQMDALLPALLRGADTIHFDLLDAPAEMRQCLTGVLREARSGRQRRGRGPRGLTDPAAILDAMRRRKDDAEVARVRAAARTTIETLRETLPRVRPGAGEWEVQADIEAAFRRATGNEPAFPSIVAAGSSATVLHYEPTHRRVNDGELLLVDVGATVEHYHGDVTRTVAVGRAPRGAVAALWQAVDAARRAGIAAVCPGASEADVHRAALAVLLEGMHELGLIDERPQAVLAAEEQRAAAPLAEAAIRPELPAYRRYFPHRVCHWLGLEVHDVGDYQVNGRPVRLESGMVLTVEPGLYVPQDDERAPAAMRGVGARLEDDVLVTPDGADILSHGWDPALT